MSIQDVRLNIVRTKVADLRSGLVSMGCALLLCDRGKYTREKVLEIIRQILKDLDEPLADLNREGF